LIDGSHRLNLAFLPTPMHELQNLSRRLGGPRLFIKRDDLTGMAFGGNKERKLEFILADALSAGAEVVITSGSIQTNHGRLTAAAARRVGMHPVLVLAGERPAELQGNLLLNDMAGADIHFVPRGRGDTEDARMDNENEITDRKVAELVAHYESQGRRVFVVPKAGATLSGVYSYVLAAQEAAYQATQARLSFHSVVVAAGGGGTLAGLHIGMNLYAPGTDVIGVSVGRGAARLEERVRDYAKGLLPDLGYGEFPIKAPIVEDGYVGEGYPIPSPASVEAARILAETEGIYVDLVYTGKAVAGLIGMIRQRRWKPEDNVLFWHTGGLPALFMQGAYLKH